MKKVVGFLVIVLLSACSGNESKTKNVQTEISSEEKLYDYDVEEKVKSLGIKLITPEKSIANYLPSVRTGNLIFLSGKIPLDKNGNMIKGKVGADLTTKQGYDAARSCAESQLSAIKAEIGDLNKVVRIVKVNGFVSTTDDFTELSEVVNGFSDLMVEVFGEKGKHARAAVGMVALPMGIACDIEMIVEVRD